MVSMYANKTPTCKTLREANKQAVGEMLYPAVTACLARFPDDTYCFMDNIDGLVTAYMLNKNPMDHNLFLIDLDQSERLQSSIECVANLMLSSIADCIVPFEPLDTPLEKLDKKLSTMVKKLRPNNYSPVITALLDLDENEKKYLFYFKHGLKTKIADVSRALKHAVVTDVGSIGLEPTRCATLEDVQVEFPVRYKEEESIQCEHFNLDEAEADSMIYDQEPVRASQCRSVESTHFENLVDGPVEEPNCNMVEVQKRLNQWKVDLFARNAHLFHVPQKRLEEQRQLIIAELTNQN